jgi:hypothetical protein
MFLPWVRAEIVGNNELKSHLEDLGVNGRLLRVLFGSYENVIDEYGTKWLRIGINRRQV